MPTKSEKLRKLYKNTRAVLRHTEAKAIPVFVFGEMRSGTNMLIKCLDRSRNTDIFNETKDDAFDAYELRDNRIIESLVLRSRATHIVFKALADSARAEEFLNHFPSAKGIWIYRRYEDVVNSAVRKWKEHNRYLYDILHDPSRARWRATNISDHSLKLIGEYYEKGVSETTARALIWYFRNRLFFEQILDRNVNVRLLNYEEAVTGPEACLPGIFNFIDLDFSSDYIRHVSPRSISRFEPPVIDAQVVELCESLKHELDSRYRLHAIESGV